MSSLSEEDLKRVKRCCCKLCGGPLTIKHMIYNKYGGQGFEIYCNHCQKIEYGTEPEVYALARKYVESFQYNYFIDMAEDRRNEMLNTAQLCEIIGWSFSQIGLINGDGFRKIKCGFF
ncbi:MAG: hypothetical protein ACRKFN_04865 [Desulfitobacterium sp.]